MQNFRRLIFLILVFLFLSCCTAGTGEGAADQSGSAVTETDLASETDVAPHYVINRIDDPSLTYEFPEDAELLEVWFPIIHDCDAALIRCGGENLLIDCASAQQANRLVALLKNTETTHLTRIINSHPHADHLLGFSAVAEVADIDELDICFHEFYTDHIIQVAAECRELGIPIRHYKDEDTWTLGGATLTAYLKRDADWDANNKSSVIKVTYGDRSILFTADIGQKAENRLAAELTDGELKSDIIKMPHHGLTQPTDSFQAAVSAELGIITNNSARVHKTRYQSEVNGTQIVYTVQGVIHLATDGNVWVAELLDFGENYTDDDEDYTVADPE